MDKCSKMYFGTYENMVQKEASKMLKKNPSDFNQTPSLFSTLQRILHYDQERKNKISLKKYLGGATCIVRLGNTLTIWRL